MYQLWLIKLDTKYNMKIILQLILLFIAIYTAAEPLKVTSEIFRETLNSKQHSLLVTYNSENPYSEKVLKSVNELSSLLKSFKIRTVLYDIKDNLDYKDFVKAKLLPSIRFYNNGFYREYTRQIKKDILYYWVKIIVSAKPDINYIKTKEEFDEVMKKDKALVIDFSKEIAESGKSLLKSLNLFYPDIPLYKNTVENQEEISLENSKFRMLFVRNYENGNKNLILNEKPDPKVVQTFVDSFEHILIQRLDEEQLQYIVRNHRTTLFVFAELDDSIILEKVRSIAIKYRKKIHFLHSNKTEPNGNILAGKLGAFEMPSVILLEFSAEKQGILRYKPRDLSIEQIDNLLDQFLNNRLSLTPYIKEEQPPKTQGFIKKIVRSTFSEFVMDKTKDVLISITSEWCEHCKEIFTMLDDVKKEYKGDSSLVFGTLNYDRNDIEMELNSFPTVILYKKNDKANPVNYQGLRDYEVLLNFLEEQLDYKRLYERKLPDDIRKKNTEREEAFEKASEL